MLTSFSSFFGGGSGGGGSVDFDRDRFLAFVVVAAIVLNSLNTTSVFRCVRFFCDEFFFLLFCKKVELICGLLFHFFFELPSFFV